MYHFLNDSLFKLFFFQLTNQILVQMDGYESTHYKWAVAPGTGTFV